MAGLSVTVTLMDDDDTIVHRVQRFGASSRDAVRTCEAVLGWLQAYSGQLSPAQWDADVTSARDRKAAAVRAR